MSDSDADGNAFTVGAAEAARLAREVQDLGFATARTIVERFVEMCGDFNAANGTGDAEAQPAGGGWMPPFWPAASEPSMRRMQSDMARASDAYLAVLSQFNEASLRFFDATRWWQPPTSQPGELVLPEVAPGGRTSARLWLHNTTASAASDLRPWCPGLASHSGGSLPPAALTCQPERVDHLDPGESRELVISVAVGDDATPGTYHGQVLVDGLPDVAFQLRVEVRPADAAAS